MASDSPTPRKNPPGEPIRIELLGGLRVSRDGESIAARLPRKAAALLAYLAVTGTPQPRERLAALLWGESPDEAARGSLRRALASLRQVVGDALLIDRTTVGINPRSALWQDTAALERTLAAGAGRAELAALRTATDLYVGDFLADAAPPDTALFDEWVATQRARYRTLGLAAFQQLAAQEAARGAYAETIATLRRLLRIDPYDEAAHRNLMEALALNGQRNAALVQYETCRQILADELGVEPTTETRALADQIRNTREGEARPGGAGVSRAPAPPILPAPLTTLIGREAELATIAARFDAAARLVTLVGNGGIGKSHLALSAAWTLRPRFADGVRWVPLAGLSASDDAAHERTTVASAIAAALGIDLSGQGAALERLADALTNRATLLVLDNVEQLHEIAPIVRSLLEAAPQLAILATSRAPIGIAGEVLLRLEGLPVPQENAPDSTATPAMRLFLERASQAAPTWAQQGSLAGVSRLLRLLDGMPLGIEMAAGLVEHYTTDEIADAIVADADFLAARGRDRPERHRSLRAVFDYTWDLLTADERRTLARVSVFRGTFGRAMAQEVTGASGSALIALADKSLLRQATVGRYSFHELLRQFAAARLDEVGETAAFRDRHAATFLRLAETIAPKLTGAEQGTGRQQLEDDLDNLRAALEWTHHTGPVEAHLRLVSSLQRFWLDRGYLAEGQDWLEGALALPTTAIPPAVRARVFHAAGVIANGRGEQHLAAERLQASMPLYHEANEPGGAVQALATLGGVAFDLGQLHEALDQYYACIALARAAHDRGEEARALGNAGETLYHLGNLDAAGEHYEQALTVARASGRRDVEAFVLGDLGNLAGRRGDPHAAEQFHRQALQLKRELGQQRQIAITLEDLAGLAAAQGAGERAARLLGAATTLRAQIGTPRPVPEQQAIERLIGTIREHLDTATWERAFAEGQERPLAEMLDEALLTTPPNEAR